MDCFKEGMIVKIYCRDFLTYNSVECHPSAKLNMIVGPNGTGKSSLVNAIVLGLGGKTNIIGRAKQLSAYVKRGCKTAKIEIELYSEPSNYTIGREFNIENRTSWTINGETVPFKQVEALIQRLNIQVDNLCQFLPQDRVQDFAKMDSKQLLENTLKTVGSNEVVVLHEKLKELREQMIGLDSRTAILRQQLEAEKKKIARLETEKQAIEQREEMMKRVATLEKKKAWVEVGEKENQKKAIQDDRKKIIDMQKEAEAILAPFEREILKTKEDMKKIDKEINKEIDIYGDSMSAGRRHVSGVGKAKDKLTSINNELNLKLETAKRRADKISGLQEEIRNLETLIQPEKEARLQQQVSEIQPCLSAKTNESAKIQAQKQDLEERMGDAARNKLRLEGAVDREMSAANKKLQILEQRFNDTFRAYEWLKENRHLFKCQVHGPIMLEINCAEEAAKFVEFIIPHRELIMFVCEDKDDMNRLLQTVRDGMKLRINVAQATKNFSRPVNENYKPSLPLENIRQFGFWDYMINRVEGPNAVLNYLCHNFGLQQIPLGNARTNSMMDQIPNQIRNYFSDTQHFSVKYSKYSGERSSRIVAVRQSILLAGSINYAAIDGYKKSIQEEVQKMNEWKTTIEKLKSKETLVDREINNFRHQKREFDQELMKLRMGRSKLKMRKDELQMFIREGLPDPEVEKANAKEEMNKVVGAVSSEQKNLVKHLKNTQSSLCRNLLNKFKLSIVQRILKEKQKASMEATKKLEDCKRMVANVEQDLRETTRAWQRAREKAMQLTDGLSPNELRFKRRYEQEFSSLPDDLEALDNLISETSARVDCMAGGRESALEEYAKTKKTIAELESSVANPELQLQSLTEEMDRKRNIWMPQVLDLISRINSNFTSFFSLMKCVGEVSLEEPDDKDEYSKYGICIKVQFRETSRLQQLGPHTQSGGERAVATAIYMLSLQELTTVPFRCVDEINQGMDENNERVVFKLMVRTVEKANSAQCFLLTPKIIPSLEYSDNVKVLCIYSGPGSISHVDFKVDTYLKKVKRRSDKIRRESLKRKHVDSDYSD